jgi:fucose permease
MNTVSALLLVIIYAAFISLGLPDSLLGVSWPVMQPELGVPLGYAGFISIVISSGTIVSSLVSSRVLRRFGTGKVTFTSVAMTAVALAGFAFTPSYVRLLLAAIPLGLGAGSVDAGLNAYVAEHYEARHMSWLHSFWGVGAVAGPLLISRFIANGGSWRNGYLTISLIQTGLVAMLFLSLPLWNRVPRRPLVDTAGPGDRSDKADGSSGSDRETAPPTRVHAPLFFPLRLRGVPFVLIAFFMYCGVESTMGLWGSSFLVRIKGLAPASAAVWVSLFYGSIAAGRFISGFVTFRVGNTALIRAGQLVILAGTLLLFLPLPPAFTLTGFVLIGLGCAPIFPSMLHETPVRFGSEHSQAVMGFQMATAYTGITVLPPVFGFIASQIGFELFPPFLLVYAAVMLASSERLISILKRKDPEPNG